MEIDDVHELVLNQSDNLHKQLAMIQFVTIKSLDEFLPGVDRNFFGQWYRCKPIKRAGVEFE